MGNIIDYLKDKIYYIMGATVLLIIILIVISSCGSGGSGGTYSAIESNMIKAAKKYYSSRENKLPEEDSTSKVTIGTLVELGLLKEVKDPKNKSNLCNGYVLTKKVDEEYVHTPFLTCKGNYEPEYLSDKIKSSGQDEYGNGIYEIDGEYVYRGDDVKNYVSFANKLWRIVMVDGTDNIELVLNESTEEEYFWENSYNIDEQEKVGVTTNYFNTNIRKSLVKYYENNFTTDEKAKIVLKDLCIGALGRKEDFNRQKECAKVQEGEYIGLLRVSDYQRASTDTNCTNRTQGQCQNHNYLESSASISSWLLNTVEENTYQVFAGFGIVSIDAADTRSINPVIYLSSDIITVQGTGTIDEPFVIK